MNFFKILTVAAMITLPTFAMAQDEALVGDPEAGESVFRKCRACHWADKDEKKIGPSLMGVIGRTAGIWGEFNYSDAMTEAGENGLVWLPEILMEYLIKPRDYIQGTRMAFPGLRNEQDRADVVAYLMQFSDPLPEEDAMEGDDAAMEGDDAAPSTE
jgi:cytochrome c